jgi:hypothetical protein
MSVLRRARRCVAAATVSRREPASDGPAPASDDPAASVTEDDTDLNRGYVAGAPTPQHQLDLYAGSWTSGVPVDATTSGPRDDLFADPRIDWGIEAIGGVAGRGVLELGPLEAGHTTMLERAGAREVVAIEAHAQAFQRCLVVKNLLGLRATFLLGDFVEYLRATDDRYDVCLASGVLYHMVDPLELLRLVTDRVDRIVLWTHYYDARVEVERPDVAARLSHTETAEAGGFTATLHRYGYGDGRSATTFCGGRLATSRWMERDDILEALDHFGFDVVAIGFEDFFEAHGPAFAVAAVRRATDPSGVSGAAAGTP